MAIDQHGKVLRDGCNACSSIPSIRKAWAASGGLDGSEFTDEQREFMLALDRWKRANRRPNPTWAEVLAVAKALGYRKVAPPLADGEKVGKPSGKE